MMETSRRTDAGHQVPEYVIPRSGVEYQVDAADPEQWFGYGTQARNVLLEALGR